MLNRLFRKRRNILLFFLVGLLIEIVVGGIVFLTILTYGIKGFAESQQPASHAINSAGALTAVLGLSLPDDATDFHGMEYDFWQSRIIGARFVIPADSLNELLTDIGFTGTLKAGVNSLHPNGDMLKQNDWWTPDKAKTYAGASWTKSQTFYDLLVDKTDPAQYIIYLLIEQG